MALRRRAALVTGRIKQAFTSRETHVAAPRYFFLRLKEYMEAVNDPALGVVDQLRAAFGAQTPAQIREANAWLESFQGRAEAWQVADQLLAMPLAAGADAADSKRVIFKTPKQVQNA